jgi:hypothetical protein
VQYELRKGTAPAGAQVLGRAAHPPFLTQGDGTYWVAACAEPRPGLRVYSAHWASLVVAGSAIAGNVVRSWDEGAGGWSGTLGGSAVLMGGVVTTSDGGNVLAVTDWIALADLLGFGGGQANATYEIAAAHQVDVGRVALCPVRITWQSQGQAVGFDVLPIADWLGTTDVLDHAASANTDVYPEIALSEDGASWGPWQRYASGAYLARRFKARMQLRTADPQTEALLESFVFAVDVPDRDDHYVNLAVPAAGLTLAFRPDGAASPAPFLGGPGSAALPALQVTILGAAPGDDAVVTNLSLAGCTIEVVNGGAGVARSINLLAQGF